MGLGSSATFASGGRTFDTIWSEDVGLAGAWLISLMLFVSVFLQPRSHSPAPFCSPDSSTSSTPITTSSVGSALWSGSVTGVSGDVEPDSYGAMGSACEEGNATKSIFICAGSHGPVHQRL